MLSNPKYKDLFNYIGANVLEREKLIEDGFPDQLQKNGEFTDVGKEARWG